MQQTPLLLAETILQRYSERGQKLATAESCTGGLLAATLTSVPGASAVFEQGFITYANTAKTALLGVPPLLLAQHGAVSAEVACAMATGGREQAQADVAVAITGIAGPTGEAPTKPIGLVYIAIATPHQVTAKRFLFNGDRTAIRTQAVNAALSGLLDAVG